MDNVRVFFDDMEKEFLRVLKKYGFSPKKAELCSHLFAVNSLEGVNSHGINRFPRFVQNISEGVVHVDAEPEIVQRANGLEQWDGCLGPGPLNALTCTDRAIQLSKTYGMGCVALCNTNHWMRGGYYGWKAAKEGFLFIGWTNTVANMPAWGATDRRLGNNPIVLAVPHGKEAIVLDMAMSQYSYGTLENYALQGRQLPFPGGYNNRGVLTTDPAEIVESWRALPVGYWKGSGLALLLDILATVLSGGFSTHEISKHTTEHSVSQVYIAFDISQLANRGTIAHTIDAIIADYRSSVAASDSDRIVYPGERALRTREENVKHGIPVSSQVWKAVREL